MNAVALVLLVLGAIALVWTCVANRRARDEQPHPLSLWAPSPRAREVSRADWESRQDFWTKELARAEAEEHPWLAEIARQSLDFLADTEPPEQAAVPTEKPKRKKGFSLDVTPEAPPADRPSQSRWAELETRYRQGSTFCEKCNEPLSVEDKEIRFWQGHVVCLGCEDRCRVEPWPMSDRHQEMLRTEAIKMYQAGKMTYEQFSCLTTAQEKGYAFGEAVQKALRVRKPERKICAFCQRAVPGKFTNVNGRIVCRECYTGLWS